MDRGQSRRVGGESGRSSAPLLFFGSAIAFTTALSVLAWRHLPYEALERYSPEDRFFAWEGVTWLFGLLFFFLGASGVLDMMGWRLGQAFRDLRRRLDGKDQDAPLVSPETVPWWLMASGLMLMLIGTIGRALLHP